MTNGPDRLPLSGIRVADFGWMIAGPLATRPLANFGAEVIRIESAARIDDIDVSGAAIESALQQVRTAAQGIAEDVFAVDREGAHAHRPCAGCEYRAWCPDARPAPTR